jgi:hypothetical protein
MTLAVESTSDVMRLRRALAIMAGTVPLGNGRTYAELEANLHKADRSILDSATDAEARDIVKRITASEPVLALLASDRYQ